MYADGSVNVGVAVQGCVEVHVVDTVIAALVPQVNRILPLCPTTTGPVVELAVRVEQDVVIDGGAAVGLIAGNVCVNSITAAAVATMPIRTIAITISLIPKAFLSFSGPIGEIFTPFTHLPVFGFPVTAPLLGTHPCEV